MAQEPASCFQAVLMCVVPLHDASSYRPGSGISVTHYRVLKKPKETHFQKNKTKTKPQPDKLRLTLCSNKKF